MPTTETPERGAQLAVQLAEVTYDRSRRALKEELEFLESASDTYLAAHGEVRIAMEVALQAAIDYGKALAFKDAVEVARIKERNGW